MAQYKRTLKIGERWFYKFDYLSKTYFSKCIYLTKQQAKKAESEKFSQVQLQSINPNLTNDILLPELITKRLYVLKSTRSPKYHRQNKDYFNILEEYFGNVFISQITRGLLTYFFIKQSEIMKAKKKTNYTVNAMYRVTKALFNFAIDTYELSLNNPCKGIKLFPIEKKLKYIPTDTEIEMVKKQCNSQQCLLIDFVAQTGARISEALAFNTNDIGSNYIVLYTRKSFNSNRIPRKLSIPECLNGSLIEPNTKLFGRWTEVPKFLDKELRCMKKNNKNVTLWGWHSLRHRFASKLSKEGKPLFEIMCLLGHSQLSTTQNYLQLLP